MAENKKSFVAYIDWKDTFDALPDDKAGQLIKHIFAYVSDEKPQTDDVLIKAVFAGIRRTLKRDLVKWKSGSDARTEKARKAGIASGKARRTKTNSDELPSSKRTQRTVSVSVSDSVSVNDKDTINSIVQSEVLIWPTFDDFWEAYDHKKNKGGAEKKWQQLNQQEKEQIMAYLPDYIESTPDKQYRKHPTTFLNQKTWEDEITKSNQIEERKRKFGEIARRYI